MTHSFSVFWSPTQGCNREHSTLRNPFNEMVNEKKGGSRQLFLSIVKRLDRTGVPSLLYYTDFLLSGVDGPYRVARTNYPLLVYSARYFTWRWQTL